MPMSRPLESSPPNEAARRLSMLRNSLLVLHKALIDSERIVYEQTFGTIESQNRFLQLLINDPWFAWLRPLSELIVVIDEALEEEEPLTPGRIRPIEDQVRALLTVSEEGQDFPRSYFEALQREPDVVLAHAEVMKRLKAG
jgi:hypothetical protein